MSDNNRVIELENRVSELEKQLNDATESLAFLVEYVHNIEEQLKDASVLWKKQQQQELNIPNNSLGLPRIDDDAIVAMTKAGVSINVQARKLNCNRSTIINHRNKLKAEGRL